MRLHERTERMEVILDTDTNTVTVVQRWKCRFLTFGRHQGRWTEGEKVTFQRRICRIIDGVWGNRAFVRIIGGADNEFNERYGNKEFAVKVKIEFVDSFENWKVNIYKARPGDLSDWDAFVNWESREISLTSHAVTLTQHRCLHGIEDERAGYWIAAHEFGHTLGYHGDFSDEYEPGNPYQGDVFSVMNLGNEIRQRHFRTVCNLLNRMCPGTSFSFRIL